MGLLLCKIMSRSSLYPQLCLDGIQILTEPDKNLISNYSHRDIICLEDVLHVGSRCFIFINQLLEIINLIIFQEFFDPYAGRSGGPGIDYDLLIIHCAIPFLLA